MCQSNIINSSLPLSLSHTIFHTRRRRRYNNSAEWKYIYNTQEKSAEEKAAAEFIMCIAFAFFPSLSHHITFASLLVTLASLALSHTHPPPLSPSKSTRHIYLGRKKTRRLIPPSHHILSVRPLLATFHLSVGFCFCCCLKFSP